jgi:hypothetical protein
MMIKIIEGLPSNVVGFEAVGRVDSADYQDVLDPAVTAALADHDKLRLIYVLGPDFADYSGGAMWEDTKVGVGHWSRWERIAVVTDKTPVKEGMKYFGWMVPGDLKVFSVAELDDAKAWAAE